MADKTWDSLSLSLSLCVRVSVSLVLASLSHRARRESSWKCTDGGWGGLSRARVDARKILLGLLRGHVRSAPRSPTGGSRQVRREPTRLVGVWCKAPTKKHNRVHEKHDSADISHGFLLIFARILPREPRSSSIHSSSCPSFFLISLLFIFLPPFFGLCTDSVAVAAVS